MSFHVNVFSFQDAVATPLVGLGSDATRDGCSKVGLGKRKSWNFAGVVLVVLAYTFVFVVCAPCMASGHDINVDTIHSFQIEKTIFLAIACSLFNVGWASVQVSHMSLVPELTAEDGKRVLLNASRYGNTIFSNVIVFLTMFTLLHTLNDGSNDNKSRPEVYRYLAMLVLGLGGICSLMFFLFLREKNSEELAHMQAWEKQEEAAALAEQDEANDASPGPLTGIRGSAHAPSAAASAIGGRSHSSHSAKHRAQSFAEQLVDTLGTVGPALDAHPGTQLGPSAHRTLLRQRSMSLDEPSTPSLMENGLTADAASNVSSSQSAFAAHASRFMSADTASAQYNKSALLKAGGGLRPLQQSHTDDGSDDSSPEWNDFSVDDETHRPFTWKEWFAMKDFYIVGLNYMCTRIVVNISQVYVPFYVTDTLDMDATAIAIVPLLIYVSSFLATLVSKPMNARFGRRVSYTIGTLLAGLAFATMLSISPEYSYLVYPAAMLLGAGNATLMVTTVSLEADLVGSGCPTGAFVYGSFSLLDKAGNGFLILAIQYLQPVFPGDERSDFTRIVTAAVPLVAAVVGALNAVVMVPKKFAKPYIELTVQEKERMARLEEERDMVKSGEGSLQRPLLKN